MIVAVALLGYAALLLTAGAAALARARWADRAPRLAVAAWLALTGSTVVSVVLGGVALVVLGAGGSATAARIKRLIAAPSPISRGRAAAGLLTVAALAAFPLVLLGGPAAAANVWNCCPHTVAAAHAATRPGHCAASHCQS